MMLLGDVGQIQELRERARDRKRRVDRHAAERAGQALEILAFAGAGALGERAHAFHGQEQFFALARLERVAQEFAEQAHVIAEWLVNIGSHGRRRGRGHARITSKPSAHHHLLYSVRVNAPGLNAWEEADA